MTFLQAIILGIVQGLTEFLPISSTAHLTLAGKVLGMIDPAHPAAWTASIAVIQLGTLAAVLVYFWRDIFDMTLSVLRDVRTNGIKTRGWSRNSRLAGQIVLGTIPVVIVGLTFKTIIEGSLTKEISVIASSLIILAIILYIAERISKHQRSIEETTWRDALWIGIGQCFALIPGSSRSGTTITAALFAGLNREAAARFSFLLSIPAILASGLLELLHAVNTITAEGAINLFIATLVSGIVGYASIAFLLRFLRTHTTFVFIWYRILLGILLWILLLAGTVA